MVKFLPSLSLPWCVDWNVVHNSHRCLYGKWAYEDKPLSYLPSLNSSTSTERWWRTGWHRWRWCYNWLTAHNDYLEDETNGNVNKYLYFILCVYTKTRCQPNLYACLPISASTSAFGSQDLLFTFCPFVRDKKRKSAAINQKILRQTGHFHTQSP